VYPEIETARRDISSIRGPHSFPDSSSYIMEKTKFVTMVIIGKYKLRTRGIPYSHDPIPAGRNELLSIWRPCDTRHRVRMKRSLDKKHTVLEITSST
jgi:hypothetical protein